MSCAPGPQSHNATEVKWERGVRAAAYEEKSLPSLFILRERVCHMCVHAFRRHQMPCGWSSYGCEPSDVGAKTLTQVPGGAAITEPSL